MTKENFERAKEIIEDIKILKNDFALPMGLSLSTKERFKIWQNGTIARLEIEFEKL